MSELRKPEDTSKMRLEQLKEILHRENALLRNSKLIQKLPDKGESIKQFAKKVEQEIKLREELQNIERAVNKLSLSENEKHVQRLCEIEKIPETERYKPFATLNKVKEVPPNSKALKIMEDCVHCNKPTKLILLPESIDILQKQDERVKEQQIKARHRRVLEKLREYQEDDEDEVSEADDNVVENYLDEENS